MPEKRKSDKYFPKKQRREDIPELFRPKPKKRAVSEQLYSLPEIAQEYTNFLLKQQLTQEQKLQKSIRWNHVEQILSKSEQFYRNITAPLHVLDSFLQFIGSTSKLTKTKSTMLSSARHELSNVENLLIYLWLVWVTDIPKSEINIPSVLERELSLVMKSFRSRKIAVRSEFNEAPLISSSPELLALCIRNILKNIIESAQPQSELLIETGLSEQHSTSTFYIYFTHPVEKDLTEEIDKAFTLFFSTKPSHIGIGLPLCREIMLAMNGDILLEMLPGPAVQTVITIPV